MSHTNSTAHYELSQFLSTDTPGWLTDVNQDNAKIDTAIYNNAQDIATNTTEIVAMKAITDEAVTTKSSSSVNNNLKYLDVNGDTVFPYVLEDNVLNANGEQALHDSGWLTLEIQHSNPIQYRKKGGVVSIEIPNQLFTGLTPDTDTLIGILPEGYRPRNMFIVQGYNDSFIIVQTDGVMLVHAPRTPLYLSFLITFMAVGE